MRGPNRIKAYLMEDEKEIGALGDGKLIIIQIHRVRTRERSLEPNSWKSKSREAMENERPYSAEV